MEQREDEQKLIFEKWKNGWIDFDSHKTLRMPEFTIRIDDFLIRFEALLASRTIHIVQRHTYTGRDDTATME